MKKMQNASIKGKVWTVLGTTISILLCKLCLAQNPDLTFDENMMRSTFKIMGGGVTGTAFVLAQPFTNNSAFSNHPPAFLVLVTAEHVLSNMPSANATLFLRIKDGDGFKKIPFDFPIRQNGSNLWRRNPKSDVAVMRLPRPNGPIDPGKYDIVGLPTDCLADDKFLTDYRIHPGDQLQVLGYPYGYEANDAGFPILRSGRIASYPLTPYTNVPTYLLDFAVYEGNSGGPVYISERRSMKAGNLESVSIFEIMGLISEQAFELERVQSSDEESIKRHQLQLGIVIPAQAIRDTLALLPPQ